MLPYMSRSSVYYTQYNNAIMKNSICKLTIMIEIIFIFIVTALCIMSLCLPQNLKLTVCLNFKPCVNQENLCLFIFF